MINENDYLKSSDLPLVAALTCYGFAVEVVDNTEPRRAFFYIRRGQDLDELVRLFHIKRLPVDPSTYFQVLKQLKTRIYQP